MNTIHGVLTNEGIFHSWDTHYATMELPILPADIESLMTVALMGTFTHMFIHPSTGLAFKREQAQGLLDTTAWDVGKEGCLISVLKNGKWKGYITSITGRSLKPYPTKNTRLIFIEQSNWPLNDATPQELLQSAGEIEQSLDVAMAGSPTSVGLRYLEKMNTRYYAHYFEKSDDVDWLELKSASLPFFAWFPPVQAETGMYLHCFDRNASHPYAASQENMGVGTPFIQEGGEFSKKLPGLWDVEVSGGDVSPLLPPLLPSSQWLPTSLLRIAEYCGLSIKVNRAFLWPEGKPVFERFAKNLWALRERYQGMQRDAIKSIMNNTTGSTRMGGEMDATMRPDWYATIVGGERGVVWYKAWKIGYEQNIYPVGAYADALYYLSFFTDAEKAVPGMLAHKSSMGGYKLAWSLPVDTHVREILATEMGAALHIGELKKMVRERNGLD